MSVPTRVPTEALWRPVCLGLLVLGLVGYPLVAFLPPALDLSDTRLVSVPFRAFVLGLSLAVLLRWTTRFVRVSFAYLACFGLFWCFYLFRLAVDAVPGRLTMLAWNEYWLFAVGVSLLPALAALVLPARFIAHRAYRPLLVAFALAAAANGLVVLEAVRGGDLGRLSHEALNPISLGHLGVSLGLLALSGILGGSAAPPMGRGKSRRGWMLSGLLVLGLGLLIASASRGPVLAFLVATGALFCRELARLRIGGAFAAGLLLVAAGGLAVGIAQRYGMMFLERAGSLALARDLTLSMRLERWEVSWRTFLENPVLGGSLETPGLDYPHNVVIEAFMSTGAVGGLLFCVLLILGLTSALQLIWNEQAGWWLGVLAVQFAVAALFSGTLYSNAPMWFAFSALMALRTGADPGPESDAMPTRVALGRVRDQGQIHRRWSAW